MGMINLAVAERTIHKGKKSGISVAVGAMVVELFYTFLAIYFMDFINENERINQFIKVSAIIVFITLGVYYMFKKNEQILATSNQSSYRDFGRGLAVAAANMLIIPFWIFVGLWLKSNGFSFPTILEILMLSLGSAMGAFCAFLLYVNLGNYIVGKRKKFVYYTNKIVSMIFFTLALVQIIRFFY